MQHVYMIEPFNDTLFQNEHYQVTELHLARLARMAASSEFCRQNIFGDGAATGFSNM